MSRRGEELRDHMLWIAKDVFLEMGFERASMDVVANRAKSSKRSLYAHFESKEKLFLAVIELVRGLFLSKLGEPSEYSAKPSEAITMFCGRYLEVLLYEASIQMCRISMGESERFPEQAGQYFDALFTQVHERLSLYLKASLGLSQRVSSEAAGCLLGQLLFPRLTRALFGLDPLPKDFDHERLSPDFDLKPVRKAVVEMLQRVDPSVS